MSKSIFPTGKEVSRQGLPWYRYDTAVVSAAAPVVGMSGRFALIELKYAICMDNVCKDGLLERSCVHVCGRLLCSAVELHL